MKHSEEFLKIVDDAKNRIKEISVSETQKHIKDSATLIDVREDNEWQAGHAKDAIHLSRGIIERDVVQQFPDKNAIYNKINRQCLIVIPRGIDEIITLPKNINYIAAHNF